jgi:competence ComEA-like helix-hairpin-helix protein
MTRKKPTRPPRSAKNAPAKVRINLANAVDLLELPGVGEREAAAIAAFRAEHGPIQDAAQLATVLGVERVDDSLVARVDFAPSDATAPEAPGA